MFACIVQLICMHRIASLWMWLMWLWPSSICCILRTTPWNTASYLRAACRHSDMATVLLGESIEQAVSSTCAHKHMYLRISTYICTCVHTEYLHKCMVFTPWQVMKPNNPHQPALPFRELVWYSDFLCMTWSSRQHSSSIRWPWTFPAFLSQHHIHM